MSRQVVCKQIIPYTEIPNTLSEDKPIIFWDTCSLLYFVTLFNRHAYKEFQWDAELLSLIENGSVYSVTSSVVLKEFNHHYDSFQRFDVEYENGFKNLLKKYAELMTNPQKEELEKGADALNVSEKLDEMIIRLWGCTYVIDEDDYFMSYAHQRTLMKVAPSSEKDSYKDCYIWLTYLKMCDMLTIKGKSYFMTENPKDYCGNSGDIPLSDIQEDMNLYNGKLFLSKSRLTIALKKSLGLIPE